MRAIRTAFLCICTGVAITVLSAWAFSFSLDGMPRSGKPSVTIPSHWIVIPENDWPSLPETHYAQHSFAYEYVDQVAQQSNIRIIVTRTSFGWPFLSMMYLEMSRWDADSGYAQEELGLLSSGFRVPRGWPQPHVGTLAIRPRFPGFVYNTLIYAIASFILWRLLAGLIAISKSNRRKRNNACLACGYTLAGLTTCPECGTQSIPEPAA